MNKMIGRIMATVALVTVVAGGAIGQSKPKAPPKAPMCPVCHMALTTKKTKDNTVAIKGPGGKMLYCCSKCDMKKKK